MKGKVNKASSQIGLLAETKENVSEKFNRWYSQNKSLVMRQTPFWAQSMTLIALGVGTIAVLGSIVIKIDEVITVNGTLKSLGGNITVKSVVPGKIKNVLVKEGEYVSKNQILAIFDTNEAQIEIDSARAMIANSQEVLSENSKLFDIRKSSIKSQINLMDAMIETKTQLLTTLKNLMDVGGFQRISYLTQKDELLSLKQQRDTAYQSLNEVDIIEQKTILENNDKIQQLQARVKQLQFLLKNKEVKASIDGVVFDNRLQKTGVYSQGELLLKIVPQEGLYAEVSIPDKDIGFIKKGQQANVRVDAFPFSRYGELNGEISRISADAKSPTDRTNFYSFPVDIKLDSDKLKFKDIFIPLSPGMSVKSNIKLRDKRLISLVSDLLVDQTENIKSLRQ